MFETNPGSKAEQVANALSGLLAGSDRFVVEVEGDMSSRARSATRTPSRRSILICMDDCSSTSRSCSALEMDSGSSSWARS